MFFFFACFFACFFALVFVSLIFDMWYCSYGLFEKGFFQLPDALRHPDAEPLVAALEGFMLDASYERFMFKLIFILQCLLAHHVCPCLLWREHSARLVQDI